MLCEHRFHRLSMRARLRRECIEQIQQTHNRAEQEMWGERRLGRNVYSGGVKVFDVVVKTALLLLANACVV